MKIYISFFLSTSIASYILTWFINKYAPLPSFLSVFIVNYLLYTIITFLPQYVLIKHSYRKRPLILLWFHIGFLAWFYVNGIIHNLMNIAP